MFYGFYLLALYGKFMALTNLGAISFKWGLLFVFGCRMLENW